MRASRLLSILLILQTRGRATAKALADEFEVSVRTIYRDIDDLSAAGVPVYAERGRAGGFSLIDGYNTRLTGMSPDEAEALLLAGLPGPATDLGLGEAAAAARLKLLAALPGARREDAQRVSSRFHFDPIGWYQYTEQHDVLPALAEAVWTERRVVIRYESWKAVVNRKLDPLGVVMKGGVWYLVAQWRGAPLTYRIAKILEFEPTEESFKRPKNFNLTEYWTNWSRDFEKRLRKDEAAVRLSPEGLKRLQFAGPVVAEAIQKTAGPPDEKGWRRVVIPIESISHAAGELLRLGPHAEALEPKALRTAISEAVSSLAELYS